MMKCSVALSTYNGSAFLRKQLDSIVFQSRQADEIVISDDASSDDTLEIIQLYRAAHPHIEWKLFSSEQNQGFKKSFRWAMMNCSGELIFLCDQDDIWAENKIERTEKIFADHPQMLSLISDFKTIDAQDRLLNPQTGGENIWVTDRVFYADKKPAKIWLREMLGRNQGQGCAMALRREVVQEYLQMDIEWTHDWILNLIAAMHGGLYYTDECLFRYRLHGLNVIGMAQGEHAQRRIPLLRKPYEFALAFKYSFLQGDLELCRRDLLTVSMDKYEYVFHCIACTGEEEQRQLDGWRQFHKKRLSLINRRKLIPYLFFFLTHRQYFSENAYFSTFEQYAIRFMMDLCVLLKR